MINLNLSSAIFIILFLLPSLWEGSGLGWKGSGVFAQNIAITDDDTYVADPSAMLDVKSVTKGMLVPRMTSAQRILISTPATGLLVFDTTEGSFFFYNGTEWVDLSAGGDVWSKNGTKIHLADSTNNVGIGTNNPQNKLSVKGDASSGPNEAIFSVVSPAGDTLFAVYPDGTRVYVNDSPAKATSSKGGFAVGGFSPSKGINTNEYLRVTPDSVRIYIDENNGVKATTSKGGFAVGGFSPSKGAAINDYLSVNSDTINASKAIYIPRMTTAERDALGFVPSEALIIFNTTDKCMQIYENNEWSNIWCFNCAPAIIIQPVDLTICSETDTSFFLSATGTSLHYQWQISTDGGSVWTSLIENSVYSGVTNWNLSIANIPVEFDGYKYRCNIAASCLPEVTSNVVTLNVGSATPVITTQPTLQYVSDTYEASFNVASVGYGLSYQWQHSTDGTIWDNIVSAGTSPVFSGYTTTILSLANIPLSYNNDKFRCVVTNLCGTTNTISRTLKIINPTLVTTIPSGITKTSANSGGDISSNGGSNVTARGLCWSSSPSPIVTGNHTTDGSGTGLFTSSMTGLTSGTTYYIRAYATNGIGTTYGNEISFTTSTVDIGESYQGGIVAYILQPADPGYISGQTHGLIADPTDQITTYEWGCFTDIIGGTSKAIGTGEQNTINIMNGCTQSPFAAKICGNLVLGGYSDWYLPSYDELYKLYLNRVIIGGFSTGYYWSSSEDGSDDAFVIGFSNGSEYSYGKNIAINVRAIRTF